LSTKHKPADGACPTVKVIDELAKQLLSQRVLFFVGAGFSLDSEKVSTKKIMASLLCRFLAMTSQPSIKEIPLFTQLRKACNEIFQLWIEADCDNEKVWYNKAVINKFVDKYYQVNEWMVHSFNVLYEHYDSNSQSTTEAFDSIIDREANFRVEFVQSITKRQSPTIKELKEQLVEQGPLDAALLASVDKQKRGKVIFIEAVGLGNSAVMRSYRETSLPESLPRYQVFGKLACEGLSPTLITTNYDLLIERGYKATGLTIGEADAADCTHLPQSALSIRRPSDFFRRAASLNPAHIIKIHGCALQYRDYKARLEQAVKAQKGVENAQAQFSEYLDSIIYTYREIQHWRDDAWSRDYLQTLLRTRSFVFCGYSGADPVMHNTIRNIYEEMQRKDVLCDIAGDASLPPAYSTRGDNLEFDSLEILNAASRAMGDECAPHEHQNFLQYHFGEQFPGCDCIFRTLLHRTLRLLQKQLLINQINNLALTLFGKPKPANEIKQICSNFNELLTDEGKHQLYDTLPDTERKLHYQLAWTEYFHQKLLRQYVVASRLRDGYLDEVSETYIPLRKHPVWSCWGVIIELAIRNAFKQLALFSGRETALSFLKPVASSQPTIHLCINGEGPTALELISSIEDSHSVHSHNYCVETKQWHFNSSQGLWHSQSKHQQVAVANTPDANTLWLLACGHQMTEQTLKGYF
jgi:hypothetical protein